MCESSVSGTGNTSSKSPWYRNKGVFDIIYFYCSVNVLGCSSKISRGCGPLNASTPPKDYSTLFLKNVARVITAPYENPPRIILDGSLSAYLSISY